MKEIFLENISLISILLSSISMMAVLYLLIMTLKKSRYDKEEQRANLDDIRKYYENQIYRTNDKLMSSKERWEDLNHLLLRHEMLKDNDGYLFENKLRLNRFLQSNGVKEQDLIPDKRLIFVLTPFNPSFNDEYSVIKKICDKVGLRCMRGDEEFFASDIFSQVLKLIVRSRLIIANLNGRNPNVLYELGIAQALDKPTILISKNPNQLPIDLKSKRFIIYKSYNELEIMLKGELIKVLSE